MEKVFKMSWRPRSSELDFVKLQTLPHDLRTIGLFIKSLVTADESKSFDAHSGLTSYSVVLK